MKKGTVIILVIIIIAAVVAFFLFFGKKKPEELSTTPDATPASSPNLGVGLSTLSEAEKAKKAQIEASTNWVAHIKDKADKAGLTYNEQLIKDVKYCIKSGKC